MALSYLVALGYKVKVVSDDEDVIWLANTLFCEVVTMETMGEYDILFSVHWDKIIPTKYLSKPSVNFHPCLFKYKGRNPIQRYIDNKDKLGSVESHYMTDKVDGGQRVIGIFFETGEISSFAEYYNLALPYYFKCIKQTIDAIL